MIEKQPTRRNCLTTLATGGLLITAGAIQVFGRQACYKVHPGVRRVDVSASISPITFNGDVYRVRGTNYKIADRGENHLLLQSPFRRYDEGKGDIIVTGIQIEGMVGEDEVVNSRIPPDILGTKRDLWLNNPVSYRQGGPPGDPIELLVGRLYENAEPSLEFPMRLKEVREPLYVAFAGSLRIS